MPATKENIRACINSKKRLNPLTETTSNFTYSFNDTFTRISEIIIDSIQIPFSFYTINSNNNVLKFNNGADSITITPGNYTATTLISEMTNKLTLVFPGQNPTVTFSVTTLKLTINKTSAFVVDSSTSIPTSTAASMLGFNVSSISSTTATGDSALNISGPNYILVRSNYLTKPIHHKTLYIDDTYQNVLYILPVNTSPGDIITYEPQFPIRLSYKFTIDDGDILDFSLYDENETLLDLNGLDWAMQVIFVTE
jgi:hypothetical protein